MDSMRADTRVFLAIHSLAFLAEMGPKLHLDVPHLVPAVPASLTPFVRASVPAALQLPSTLIVALYF